MPYLTDDELRELGFRKLGRNVKISQKVSIYDTDKIELGDHVRIDDYCVVSGKITLGRNVHIAVMCNLAGGERGIVMEDFSGLAYGCHVFTQSDDYSGAYLTNPTVPDEYKRELKAPILIKRHVIVGTCSIVMPGIVLEEGCAIGAMSMVTKSTQPWSIYTGVPAKRIKERKRDLLALEQTYLDACR